MKKTLVMAVVIVIIAGVTSPRHTPPGEEIAYVLEGTLEYSVEGSQPVILKAGDVLFIPAGVTHAEKNVSKGRGVELATYVVEKGKPLVEMVKWRVQSP